MLWIALGLASSLFSAIGATIGERSAADSKTLAVWFRIITVVGCLPFITALTLPTDWQYWALALFSALIMGTSDIINFKAYKSIGAGATSRFRRTAVLITFLLWLVISPSLLWHYLDRPFVAAAVFSTHLLAVYFALRLKKSDASWAGLKLMWYPILASALGPIISKTSFDYVPSNIQGVFSYIFIQSTAVMIGYSVYALVRDGWRGAVPSLKSLVAHGAWKPGIAMSTLLLCALVVKHYSYSIVENPAYISVLLLTDTLWLLLYHKWRGIPDKTDAVSGMGIVGCAAALIVLQILFE